MLVGAAVTALDETRKLPQTILTYPMTVASQLAHLVMKVQQDVADLVNRGDEALEELFPPKDEQPEWATFDEDLPDDPFKNLSDDDVVSDISSARRTEGRFALFSEGEPEQAASSVAATASTHCLDPGSTTKTASNAISTIMVITPITTLVTRLDLETISLLMLPPPIRQATVCAALRQGNTAPESPIGKSAMHIARRSAVYAAAKRCQRSGHRRSAA